MRAGLPFWSASPAAPVCWAVSCALLPRALIFTVLRLTGLDSRFEIFDAAPEAIGVPAHPDIRARSSARLPLRPPAVPEDQETLSPGDGVYWFWLYWKFALVS